MTVYENMHPFAVSFQTKPKDRKKTNNFLSFCGKPKKIILKSGKTTPRT